MDDLLVPLAVVGGLFVVFWFLMGSGRRATSRPRVGDHEFAVDAASEGHTPAGYAFILGLEAGANAVSAAFGENAPINEAAVQFAWNRISVSNRGEFDRGLRVGAMLAAIRWDEDPAGADADFDSLVERSGLPEDRFLEVAARQEMKDVGSALREELCADPDMDMQAAFRARIMQVAERLPGRVRLKFAVACYRIIGGALVDVASAPATRPAP